MGSVRTLLCSFVLFFFNDTATTEIYTLSLHDALPISIGRNRLSSWILGRSRVGSETYIVGGTKDHQESAWIEPGGVLRRVQPHLHEHAGARPQKPHLEQAGRAVRGHGGAPAHGADAGLCRRRSAAGRSCWGAGAPGVGGCGEEE